MTEFINGSPGFIGAPYITDLAGTPIDQNKLVLGTNVLLNLGFQNTSSAHRIPNNTIQPFIDIGPNMELVASPLSELSTYFDFRQETHNGSNVIVMSQKAGDHADIPPQPFNGIFSFVVKPVKVGVSSFVANINIHNTNPDFKTADQVDQDNSTNSQYTVLPIPVEKPKEEPTPPKENPERAVAIAHLNYLSEKKFVTVKERAAIVKRINKKYKV